MLLITFLNFSNVVIGIKYEVPSVGEMKLWKGLLHEVYYESIDVHHAWYAHTHTTD